MEIIYNKEQDNYNISSLFTKDVLEGWQPRKKRFLTCNRKLEFYPKTIEAYSYGYWKFCMIYNGRIILNMYNYSPTTSKHQCQIYWMLKDLDLPFTVIEVSKSLNESTIKNTGSLYLYKNLFNNLIELRKNIRKKTRIKIEANIIELKNKIREYKRFGINAEKRDINNMLSCAKGSYYSNRYFMQIEKLYENFKQYRTTFSNAEREKINKRIFKIKNKIRNIKKMNNNIITRSYDINYIKNSYIDFIGDSKNFELTRILKGVA